MGRELPGRFVAGDPLRAIAALAVLSWHAAFLGLAAAGLQGGIGPNLDIAVVYGNPVGDVLRVGALGVYLFFVLSGYLIARPFVRAYITHGKRPRLRRYARNRVLRIYPAFLVVCALLLVIYGTLGLDAGQTLGILLLTDIAGAGWSQHIAHAWSLSVEVAFYVAVPLFFLSLGAISGRVRTPAARAALLAAIALAAGAASLASSFNGAIYGTLVGEFWAFTPGLLLAIAEPFAAPRLAGRARVGRIALGAALAGIVLFLSFLPLVRLAGGGAGKLLSLFAAGLVIGAPLVAQWAGVRPWRVLDNRLAHWLGERSYPIFLLHWPIAWEVSQLVADTGWGAKKVLLGTLLITLALTLVASDLLHRAVERPVLRRRARTAPAPAKPQPEPAPAKPQPATA